MRKALSLCFILVCVFSFVGCDSSDIVSKNSDLLALEGNLWVCSSLSTNNSYFLESLELIPENAFPIQPIMSEGFITMPYPIPAEETDIDEDGKPEITLQDNLLYFNEGKVNFGMALNDLVIAENEESAKLVLEDIKNESGITPDDVIFLGVDFDYEMKGDRIKVFFTEESFEGTYCTEENLIFYDAEYKLDNGVLTLTQHYNLDTDETYTDIWNFIVSKKFDQEDIDNPILSPYLIKYDY